MTARVVQMLVTAGREEKGCRSRCGHVQFGAPGKVQGAGVQTGTAPGTWKGDEVRGGRRPSRRDEQPLTRTDLQADVASGVQNRKCSPVRTRGGGCS